MEESRLIYSVDKLSNLRSIVKQDLRELGVKVPKLKKNKKLNQSRNSSQDGISTPNIFGNYLSQVPSKYVSDCGFVPTFLVEAAQIIEKHRDVEGIFRKSGSISRQKELKQQIEDNQPLQSNNVHDVTGVVKQFFRELPEPLFTSIFHDSFVRCYHLDPPKQVEAMLLLCLMLPIEHLSTLRFTMKMLCDLAARCSHNKMDVGNLAVVLAPNIMHVNSRSQKMNSAEEKLLQLQTAIVGVLIRHAEGIGLVSDSLYQRTALMTECFGTEDELDASDDNTLENSKDIREGRNKVRKRSNSLQERTNKDGQKKIRKRSSSLQGIVNSIGRGFAKLRRSTDGSKNTSATCVSSSNSTMDYQPDSSAAAQPCQSESLPVTQHQAELSLASHGQPMATPVLMRKRKMAGGETMPFSATKRKAILDQLPQRSALGATPFTPASSKKRGNFSMMDTPTVTKSQLISEGTPKQDGNKSLRKKINLFSPASGRKSKRCKTGAESCSGGLRKSARTKHLFRRLSRDKDRDSNDDDEEDAPAGVPQSQSAMELDRSSLGLTRTPSSPSLQDYPSSPPHHRHQAADDSALNQGFIDPDATMASVVGVRERGRPLRRADSHSKAGPKAGDRRSASAEGTLRRGQPNSVASGLLEGKKENVKNLRRSFDKSDISHPIPISLPHQSARSGHSDKHSSASSERCGAGAVRSGSAVSEQSKARPARTLVERLKSSEAQGTELESSLLNVVLPPPSGFNDQSMMDVSCDNVLGQQSDDESEAGFSTISGGTVIHRPPGQQGAASGAIIHYGSSVSVMAPHPQHLQPSVSADSLISTGSEASEPSLLGSRAMNRSASVDSGKGSLLDNAEKRGPKSGVRSTDLEMARVKLEGGTSSSLENLASYCVPVTQHSMKSMSEQDLKALRDVEKPPCRSHSMYVGGHHMPNIVPNLQISATTHSILSRAGYVDGSVPPRAKDVSIRSPQRSESARRSFRSRDRHQCSYRLDRSATFRKERSNILFSDHPPTPVMEESMELEDGGKDFPQRTVAELEPQPMEEEEEEDCTDAVNKPEAEEEEVWVKMDQHNVDRLREVRDVEGEEAGMATSSLSISLKRAEQRNMARHESVAQIKERQHGRVAHSVQQINSSLDHSALEQPSTAQPALQFQQCTTRKRGVSPIRIPTIFAKSRTDPAATRYHELALKFQGQKRAEGGAGGSRVESSSSSSQQSEEQAMQHRAQREDRGSKVNPDLRSSLMETIKEVSTPRGHKHPPADQPGEGSRSPLRESTNTKPGSAPDNTIQLRTAKGLTPHQVHKYGSKGPSSDRSPGKPVKRLQSPRSPHRHSPQKSKEREALHLESRNFSEQY